MVLEQAVERSGSSGWRWKLSHLVVFCILLSGCRSPGANIKPSIEFSKVPQAEEGGPDKLDTIEGRVIGARPGQQIVLFARSGVWWVQPLAGQPFTAIQPDLKWKSSTHLGTEYAALLVEPGYRPPATIDVLPKEGGAVIAVATTKGKEAARAASQSLHFSGYEWAVRHVASERGGSTNAFDPANAWTDASGFLHLRIAQNSGQWTCAEVKLSHSLGYGSYQFVVRETSHLEPAAVFGMFTWDDAIADQNHREVDIEISRWGDGASKNAQYVIQPYYVPANVVRFIAPSGTLTHSFRWEPGKVSFKTARGAATGAGSRVVAEHAFTSGVPSPGGESIHLNLYVYGHAKTTLQNGAEVVIEKFEYLP
ncbi:MAG: glycoside hydrolase family 16 protein [Blastocatellia bacterium]